MKIRHAVFGVAPAFGGGAALRDRAGKIDAKREEDERRLHVMISGNISDGDHTAVCMPG